jgi:hypothetical protein
MAIGMAEAVTVVIWAAGIMLGTGDCIVWVDKAEDALTVILYVSAGGAGPVVAALTPGITTAAPPESKEQTARMMNADLSATRVFDMLKVRLLDQLLCEVTQAVDRLYVEYGVTGQCKSVPHRIHPYLVQYLSCHWKRGKGAGYTTRRVIPPP